MQTPAPVPLGLQPSFGFGDRLGMATPGHVAALKAAGGRVRPIFAQQSIREMARTGRTPRQVIDDAASGALAAGYDGPAGADADHLKTFADVDATAAVGFVFFTIDPSSQVDAFADSYTPQQLAEKFAEVRLETDWLPRYAGKRVTLSSGTVIDFDEQVLRKAAVKYGRAIRHGIAMADHVRAVQDRIGRPHEIELGVDATPQPTTAAEHYIIADQCLSHGMKLVSLAPRFVGEFEQGVDFRGDRQAFVRSLADHAEVARMLGPYKLSLHTGSDKLSIYGLVARLTHGLFHVKTAGTSYLEALRTVCRKEPALFRRVVDFARDRYETDRANYHVSARLETIPAPAAVRHDQTLEKLYLGFWPTTPAGGGFSEPGRQILHTTFGSVLMHATLGPEVKGVIQYHKDTYGELLTAHFTRHLDALNV